jgi:hypothetical protein
MIKMAGEGELWEIGATSDEVAEIMADEITVIGEIIGMGDAHQWAMMRLAQYRSAKSVELHDSTTEP